MIPAHVAPRSPSSRDTEIHYHQLLNIFFYYDTNVDSPDKIKLGFIWLMTVLGSLRPLTWNLIKHREEDQLFSLRYFNRLTPKQC